MLVMFFGVMIIEPNGVPTTTCPGCDIWLLMKNHISMSTFHKNILQVILFDFVIEWFQIFTGGFEEGIPNIPITNIPFLVSPFSFFVSSCLDDRGKTGETSPCFCFQGAYRVLCEKVFFKWKVGQKWSVKNEQVSYPMFVSDFLCEIVFLRRRNVSEKKIYFWSIWRKTLLLDLEDECYQRMVRKNGYWFWKNGWGFRKAGIIPKVRIFCF